MSLLNLYDFQVLKEDKSPNHFTVNFLIFSVLIFRFMPNHELHSKNICLSKWHKNLVPKLDTC